MVPWYKRSSRRAPKGNAQLEAGLDKMRAFLNNPANKRRVRDNMTASQRLAMRELRDLPHTSGAQVVFEDKGNRFVVRDLDEQDNQILEKLQDRDKFDKLDAMIGIDCGMSDFVEDINPCKKQSDSMPDDVSGPFF